MTREQALLEWLHSPAVRLYSTDERRGSGYSRPRTPEETETILSALARKGARADYCRTPAYRNPDEIRFDLLAKELDKRFSSK
jgi:hypothetical protein